MSNRILKDKFLLPLCVSLIGCLGFLRSGSWYSYLIFFVIVITILSIAAYIRKDLYVKEHYIDNDVLRLKYHINFSGNEIKEIEIKNSSIKVLKYRSISFFEPYYVCIIKFLDNENLYDRMIFKFSDEKQFTEVINHISHLESLNKN